MNQLAEKAKGARAFLTVLLDRAHNNYATNKGLTIVELIPCLLRANTHYAIKLILLPFYSVTDFENVF